MVFWACRWMMGLFCSSQSYWLRQSQSDKTVFALGRTPFEGRLASSGKFLGVKMDRRRRVSFSGANRSEWGTNERKESRAAAEQSIQVLCHSIRATNITHPVSPVFTKRTHFQPNRWRKKRKDHLQLFKLGQKRRGHKSRDKRAKTRTSCGTKTHELRNKRLSNKRGWSGGRFGRRFGDDLCLDCANFPYVGGGHKQLHLQTQNSPDLTTKSPSLLSGALSVKEAHATETDGLARRRLEKEGHRTLQFACWLSSSSFNNS